MKESDYQRTIIDYLEILEKDLFLNICDLVAIT